VAISPKEKINQISSNTSKIPLIFRVGKSTFFLQCNQKIQKNIQMALFVGISQAAKG
jgi:hypothetical protein